MSRRCTTFTSWSPKPRVRRLQPLRLPGRRSLPSLPRFFTLSIIQDKLPAFALDEEKGCTGPPNPQVLFLGPMK